jgi:hypothetical protein
MVKLESMDTLLVQVWHRDRAYPLEPCMLGVNYL